MAVNGRFQKENRQALCQTAPIIKWVRRIERIADLQERRGSKSYQALRIYQTRGGIPEYWQSKGSGQDLRGPTHPVQPTDHRVVAYEPIRPRSASGVRDSRMPSFCIRS